MSERSAALFRSREFFHPADENLGLVDGHVGVANQGREIVDDVALADPLVSPVPGHAHVMDDLAVNQEGPDARSDERLGADGCTRSDDLHGFQVDHADPPGMLGAELDEELGLKRR